MSYVQSFHRVSELSLEKATKEALDAFESFCQQYPHMVKGYMLDAIESLKDALNEHTPLDLPDRNYQRGFRDGYEMRCIEVSGALV